MRTFKIFAVSCMLAIAVPAEASFLKKCLAAFGVVEYKANTVVLEVRGDKSRIPVGEIKALVQQNGFIVDKMSALGAGTFTDVVHITFRKVASDGTVSPAQTAVVKTPGGMLRAPDERPASEAALANAYKFQNLAQNVEGVNAPKVLAPLWKDGIEGSTLFGYISELAPGEQAGDFMKKHPEREAEVKALVKDANDKMLAKGMFDIDSNTPTGVAENVLVSEKDGKLMVYFIDFGMFMSTNP